MCGGRRLQVPLAFLLVSGALFIFPQHVLGQTADRSDSRPVLTLRPGAEAPENKSVDPRVAAVTVKTFNALHLKSFTPETIFENGELSGGWKGCGEGSVQLNKCKVLSSYVDRLSIEYSYDRERLAEYTLHEPSIDVRTNGATAELVDFSFRNELQFTVLFHCHLENKTTSSEVFDLRIPVLTGYEIKTRFIKNCTAGINPYIHLGIVHEGDERILSTLSGPISVPPTVLTTDCFIRLSDPAQAQAYGRATVVASSSSIGVSLRGISEPATIIVGQDLRFSVLYECDVNGKVDVNVTVPIPPWNDLSMALSKTCGGIVPNMVSVGTGPTLSDVVRNGIPEPQFAGGNVNSTENGGEKFEIDEGTHSMKLYIRNTNRIGQASVHLGKIHLTVSEPSVLTASAMNFAGMSISAIEPGASVGELLRFVCRTAGTVRVVVSIPVLQYEVLEFRLTKKCRAPVSYRESGVESWWTVGGVEDIAFVVLAVLLIGWCLRIRGKENALGVLGTQGYRRVSGSVT